MKLSGTLPKGDANGVATLDPFAVNESDFRHVVIAVISTKKIITDIESGDTEAQMRIDRIERVLATDAPLAEQLLRRALQKRLGETTLSIEVEDDIAAIFREALLEIHGDEPTTDAKDKGDEPPTLDEAANGEAK